ncbi:MAG: hypothetical protein JXB10_06190 [Pirellulales bacterium]|nr:hypothetical protein [Pirellulales bacterium]
MSFFRTNVIAFCVLSGLLWGCGGNPEKKAAAPRSPSRPRMTKKDVPVVPLPRKQAAKPDAPAAEEPPPVEPPVREPAAPHRTLGDLLSEPVDSAMRMMPHVPPRAIDDAQAAAEGIRKLTGRRLTLYTDLTGPEIDRLPEFFEQAFPQWCAYFHVDPDRQADWKMTGFLMKDRKRFRRTGLLPDGLLPDDLPYPHGYSLNYELWLNEQPSDYYRRHLLLHEGTHGFMNTMLGACGPSWYMEGMAELLSTHAVQDGKLRLNYFPRHNEEAPQWGRIGIIQDAFAAYQAKPLAVVWAYPPAAYQETAAYAWSWAVAALLDRHPRYQARFRQLSKEVLNPHFQQKFDELFAADRQELSEEWQVFVSCMEYGYDVPRMAIDFQPGRPLPPTGGSVQVAADRGWQSSGYRLEAGRTYRLTAAGRWEKHCRPDCWPGVKNLPEKITLEPGGISIRYYRGRPLGRLLAAVRPDAPDANQPSAFLDPIAVGLISEITPRVSGTLYLRVNDSAAELRDNSGEIYVNIAIVK